MKSVRVYYVHSIIGSDCYPGDSKCWPLKTFREAKRRQEEDPSEKAEVCFMADHPADDPIVISETCNIVGVFGLADEGCDWPTIFAERIGGGA